MATGQFDDDERILVNVKAGNLSHRHRSSRDVNRGIEHGGQGDVGFPHVQLHPMNEVQNGRVLESRLAPIQIPGRLADHRIEPGFRSLMVWSGQIQDLRIGGDGVIDGDQSTVFGHYSPSPIRPSLQDEIDAGQMLRPPAGIDQQDAIDQCFRDSPMGMSHEDHVHTGNGFGDLIGAILSGDLRGPTTSRLRIAIQSHMSGDDDDVTSFLPAENGNPPPSFLQGIAKFQPGVVLPVLPHWHPRSRQPENAHSHTPHFADRIRREIIRSIALASDVGREPGKTSLTPCLVNHLETEIEFVIPHCHGVIAHVAHDQHHGIGPCSRSRVMIIDERRALNAIAVVDEECIGLLSTNPFDDGEDLGQATIGRPISVIVDRIDVPMNVGRTEKRDRGPRRWIDIETLNAPGTQAEKSEGEEQRGGTTKSPLTVFHVDQPSRSSIGRVIMNQSVNRRQVGES